MNWCRVALAAVAALTAEALLGATKAPAGYVAVTYYALVRWVAQRWPWVDVADHADAAGHRQRLPARTLNRPRRASTPHET